MQHSSEKNNREFEFAEKNREYLEGKRKSKKSFNLEPEKLKEVRKKHSSNKVCCWSIFLIIVLAVGLIYYFVKNIQSDLVKDFLEKKEQVEEMLPKAKEEVKTGIKQGEDLYNDTKKNVENIQGTYNQAQDTFETVQEGYDKAKDVVDTLKDKIPQE